MVNIKQAGGRIQFLPWVLSEFYVTQYFTVMSSKGIGEKNLLQVWEEISNMWTNIKIMGITPRIYYGDSTVVVVVLKIMLKYIGNNRLSTMLWIILDRKSVV
jgi:hypothetical protein